MRRAGHRRDAVDHGVGEADVALDPAGQVGVDQAGEGQRGLAGHVAVVGEVVAGHHGERPDAVAAALGQGRAEDPDRTRSKYDNPVTGLDTAILYHRIVGYATGFGQAGLFEGQVVRDLV